MSEQQTKECPFCAEQVIVNAKKCKHCGEIIDVTLRMAEDAKKASSRNPMVFMNAGGGGASAAAASASSGNGNMAKRNFPHFLHCLVTIFTMGMWLPIWILHYLFRDKNYYW